MPRKIIFTVIVSLCFLQLLFCCKKQRDNYPAFKKENFQKNIECVMDFPDTVYVNQLYDGIVDYKSPFDTIITTFGNKEKNRHSRLFFVIADTINYNYKNLKQSITDTFGALNNRKIVFHDIQFNKTGTYYIDGIVNDHIIIDIHKKDKEGYGLSRVIEIEERLIHKVVVINKTDGIQLKPRWNSQSDSIYFQPDRSDISTAR